jgi:hypothetical protein
MSIVTYRIYEDASGVAARASCPAAVAKSYLVEALFVRERPMRDTCLGAEFLPSHRRAIHAYRLRIGREGHRCRAQGSH